jgi:hypothetical protein
MQISKYKGVSLKYKKLRSENMGIRFHRMKLKYEDMDSKGHS